MPCHAQYPPGPLSGRLNERDECILGLQEELDAYDARQGELEEALAAATAAPVRGESQPPFLEPPSAGLRPRGAGAGPFWGARTGKERRVAPKGVGCPG